MPRQTSAGLAPRSERLDMPLRRARDGWNNNYRRGLLLLPGNVGRYLTPYQPGIQSSLDVRNVGALGARGESGSRSVGTSASSAAHPVNEVLWNLRKIKIHNVRYTFHVNSAGCYVGGHEHTIFALLEAAQRLI